MWVAAKLFFSGVFEKALEWGSAALKWLLEEPWRLAAIVFAVSWAWASFITVPNIEAERDRAQVQTGAVRAAFVATVANYRAASAAAQRAAEANVARVEAEQDAITQETIDDYEARLAAARAHHARLADQLRARSRTAAADPRGADAAGLPGSGTATGSADGAPADPRLPASCPAERVCLTLDEALIATEQAIQLDALISWNLRQAAVPFQIEVEDDE